MVGKERIPTGVRMPIRSGWSRSNKCMGTIPTQWRRRQPEIIIMVAAVPVAVMTTDNKWPATDRTEDEYPSWQEAFATMLDLVG
jgi:hypothetical protein